MGRAPPGTFGSIGLAVPFALVQKCLPAQVLLTGLPLLPTSSGTQLAVCNMSTVLGVQQAGSAALLETCSVGCSPLHIQLDYSPWKFYKHMMRTVSFAHPGVLPQCAHMHCDMLSVLAFFWVGA